MNIMNIYVKETILTNLARMRISISPIPMLYEVIFSQFHE